MRRLLVLATATLTSLVIAGTSYGRATVGTFYDQHTETFSGPLPECLSPDLVGINTGIETTTGHFTATNTGFHFQGTTTFNYTTTFPDGSYVVGAARTPFDFNTSVSEGTTTTQITQETRTIYNANSQPIGHVFIHALSHVTFRDANGNGNPDPGEITSSVDRFFFTCG